MMVTQNAMSETVGSNDTQLIIYWDVHSLRFLCRLSYMLFFMMINQYILFVIYMIKTAQY